MLLCPERTTDLDRLRSEYARRADSYGVLTDPIVIRGAYSHLMAVLARVRELEGYPADYWVGLAPVHPPLR